MGRPRKRRREEIDENQSAKAHELYEQLPITNELARPMDLRGTSTWHMPDLSRCSDVDDFSHDVSFPNTIEVEDLSLFNQTEILKYGLTNKQLPIASFPDEMPCDINSPAEEPCLATTDISCSCLANIYLSITNVQSSSHMGFPFALGPLRAGLITADKLLACDRCTNELSSVQQNILLLNALLSAIAAGFDKLLRSINAEASRAQNENAKKKVCMGDTSVQNIHLHTGSPDCPGAFFVELDAQEWSNVAKRVVRKEIFDDHGTLTLEKLLSNLENRQREWHQYPPPDLVDIIGIHTPMNEDDYTCLRLTKEVRRMILRFPL